MADGTLFVSLSRVLPELVFPLTVACGLLAIGLGLWRRPRLRTAALTTALALLLGASCGPVSSALGRSLEWRFPPAPDPAPADAIVVLGGATRPAIPPRIGFELDAAGNRLFEAARLYRAGKAPRVLVSGGRFDFTGRLGPEAPEMATVLGMLGVPDTAMLLEDRSRNTFENAVEAWRTLQPLGARRILLVTSALHMPRAVGLFRHQGFEVVPAPTDFTVVEQDEAAWTNPFVLALRALPDAGSLAYTTRVLREYLGIAVYRALGRLS